jgi:hypothetical protein
MLFFNVWRNIMTTRHITIADTFFHHLSFAMRCALRRPTYVILLLPGILMLSGCQARQINLFDGNTLGHWKSTDFKDHGEVYIKEGAIYLEKGNDLTGVTWTGSVVQMNYEISLEAMRLVGNDFFCGLTFPIDNNSCTLILGGWGGQVCGLSNIDYFDAADNETSRIIPFENDEWYHVRLRVTPERIQAWLNDSELVDVETKERYLDVKPDMVPSRPLGIATRQTTGAIRNIKLIMLKD